VFCKKNVCTLSTKICILRQNITIQRKKEGENLTTLYKCFNCSLGKKIICHPSPNLLNRDIRKIMAEKKYRPPKQKLQTKIIRHKLEIKE
jgi:hypothetical protein